MIEIKAKFNAYYLLYVYDGIILLFLLKLRYFGYDIWFSIVLKRNASFKGTIKYFALHVLLNIIHRNEMKKFTCNI